MYRSILVPTDGSEASMAAVDEALDLAAAVGADTIHLVYIVDESATTLLFSDQSLGSLLEAFVEEGEEATRAAADRCESSDVSVVTDVVRGMSVSEAILDYAREHDVDVVVMGTRGRKGLGHLLGSTTERVSGHSPIPVLVVAGEERDAEPAEEAEEGRGDEAPPDATAEER